MAAIPSTSISLPGEPFIGESLDLTVGFDNTGDVTGYGPFILFYIDQTGADGDDGLTFISDSASYLGASVTTTEIPLDGTGSSTFSVFGVEQTVSTPTGFDSGDTLVVMELPFGSFVVDQPEADVSVSLDVSNLADLDTAINLQSQGGFVFGNTPEEETNGSDDPIYEDISLDPLDTVSPQLVTLTKNYLGPEGETATGPNFVRQYELVVDIANGQTITNLDVTDILPDNMQFVDLVSIVDSTGTPINSSRITEVATPDDGGLTSIGSVKVTENDIGSDGNPTPGGTLTRRIDTITGTTEERDLVLTYEFFIPRLDASSAVIIDANTGDDIISTNESQVGDNDTGDSDNIWDPDDTRDGDQEVYIPSTATSPNSPTHNLEDQSIAIQKTVTNDTDSENTPGDVLKYTLEFQISDYFAFEDVKVTDVFSDGQRFYNAVGFEPTLSFNEHSNPDVSGAQFTITNYNPVGISGSGTLSDSDLLIIDETDINNTNDGSGNTTLIFDVSGLLATQTGQDNQLLGGGIPDGGFTDYNNNNDPDLSLNNNPLLNTGFDGTTGTITFYTQIQGEYRDDYPSGDQSVDIGDELSNNATIEGAVLDVDSLAQTTYLEDDDTSIAAITIEEGTLYKSIYAINGLIFSGADTDTDLSDGLTGYSNGVNVTPGDRITYRLTYELPTTDVEDLTLTDYFPLPIFDIDTEFASTTFDSTVSSAVPSAGETKYGPLDTFSTRTDASSNNPNLTFSVQGGANSLTYSYADFDDDENQSSIVDILVTVTAKDEPAADGLLFTNQVRQTNKNTFNEDSDPLDAIIQVTLDQPNIVDITKGVVAYSSDNNDIAFSPSFTAPSGVTFATGGGTTFTGSSDPVSSTDLVSNPIDSDLTGGLEAGDIVTFALVVENQGSSRKGAFDVTLQDDLPTGFKIPSAGLNLNVTDGTGATITYTGLDDNDGSGDDLFGTGIELNDPGSTMGSGSGITEDTDAGALDTYDTDSGENLAIITFDLEVDEIGPYQDFDNARDVEQITNTATLVSYANIEGGEDFSGSTDTAIVDIELPELTKSIVATSESHTSEDGDGTTNNNNSTTGRRRLAIGEIIRYRLVAALPEGTANNFQLRDRLPGGLLFLDDNTATAAFVSDDAPISSVDTTTSYSNPLSIGLGSPSVFDNDLWISGTSDSGITPTFLLADSNVGRNKTIGNNNASDPDPDTYYSGTDAYFKFGDITNPDRDEDDEYVIVEFNALVTNDYQTNAAGDVSTDNDSGENRTNRFQVNVGTGSNFNTADELIRSDASYIRIVEPDLSLNKEVGADTSSFSTSTLLTDSGNTVYFRLTFDNNGSQNVRSTAFEVELTDRVPAGLTLTGIDSIDWDDGDGSNSSATENSVSSGTPITAGVMTINPAFDLGTGDITIGVNQMPSDAEITVIYSATVDGTVNPDEPLTNTANIVYTSLPGNNGTTGNGTGSDTPGTSGSTTGERDGVTPTNTANDHTASSNANVQIDPLVPIKSLISTTDNSTDDSDGVIIGETARYRLVVQVPEGIATDFVIEESLPDGLQYVYGSEKIAFISDDTNPLSSSDISGVGLNIDDDDANVIDTANIDTDINATPSFDLTTGITSEFGGDTNFIAGEDITFDLGTVTNSNSDSDNEYVVIEFDALVTDVTALDNQRTQTNSFSVSSDGNDPVTSNDVSIDVLIDYGDTPDSGSGTAVGNYETTDKTGGTTGDGAAHGIVNDLYIGINGPDNDSGALQNIDADADDTDVSPDDEDGVTFGTLRTDTQTYSLTTIPLTNNTLTTATFVGWIDFDGNGEFETGEAVTASVADGATSATLTWNNIPADIVAGTTYARFRLSTDPNLNTSLPNGYVDDGEVEDYQLNIVGVDYGDAPDTSTSPSTAAGEYQTTAADSGASHTIVSGLSIGSSVDGDTGTLQNSGATADDISNTGSTNDEDGISSFDPLGSNSKSYSVDVDLTNTTGGDVTLIGWIDFDGNGSFDPDEEAIATVNNNDTTATLSWNTIPEDITAGTTYARFRISSDSLTESDSTGAATDGEVEDYQIEIKNGVTGTDSAEVIDTTTTPPIATTTGNDYIIANKGEDTLTGAGGNDCYYFNETSDGLDSITDFTPAEDKIVLSNILANEVGYAGSDPFGDGYVELLGFNHPTYGASTIVQIDFDAGNESDPTTDLYHKDLVFLRGVDVNSLDISRDFII